MIFRILLLINLISWIHGTLVVKVTQTSYQAEENQDITLEWTFTTRPDTPPTFLFVFCELITDHTVSVLYRLHDAVEVPESQDERFSGRVQFDKDVLREGRIRLQLSRLRTNDSGLYVCKVRTDDGRSSGRCRLNVTAKVWPKPETEPETQNQTLRERIALYCGLGLSAAPILAACYVVFSPSLLGKICYSQADTSTIQLTSRTIVDLQGLWRSFVTLTVLQWILENLQIGRELTLVECLFLIVFEIVWAIIKDY